jgi:glycosyltransferase involved in cell wall biosynthesis
MSSQYRETSLPAVMDHKPRLSVLTITYNHEAYIAECLQGALAQRTEFPFEIVVGEDCSTDGTRALCERFQRERPDRIRLVLQDANTGGYRNFESVLDCCRGEYVAILDGDDYWTGAEKLQRQVDLLDRHPEWSMCFHNVRIVTEGLPDRLFFERPGRPVYTQEDFVERNFVPTCSCVFRNRGNGVLPPWYYDREKNPYADWILHVINTSFGDAGYVDEVMGVHRRHAGGIWGGTFDGTVEGDIRRMRKRQTAYERLQECIAPRLRAAVCRQRALNAYHLSLAYREKGDWPAVRRCLWQAFRTEPFARIPFLRSGLIAAMQGFRKQ